MIRQALFKEGARLEELILHRCDLAVVAPGQFVVAYTPACPPPRSGPVHSFRRQDSTLLGSALRTTRGTLGGNAMRVGLEPRERGKG